MRLAILIWIASVASAYENATSTLLDVNATTLVIQNSGTGGSDITERFAPGSGQRMKITVTPINVNPSGATYTACADPCSVSLNRNWGQQHLFAEIVDGSGNPLSTPRPAHRVLPQVELTAAAPGAWTFPIEVIGQDRYVKRVQVTNPGSVRTNLRMEMWVHNAGCSIPPYVLTWVSGDNFSNFGVDGSGSPAIHSSLYIGTTRYPITVVTDATHITVGNATSPPGGLPTNGNGVTYARCISAAPGGVEPSWPVCGNMF